LDAYTGGQLTLTGGTPWRWFRPHPQYKVRVPMVAWPVAFVAPAVASESYPVKFGYAGSFRATARGLVPAIAQAGNVATDGSVFSEVTIPAGTTYARFSLFDTHVTPASDLDLVVLDPAGNVVGSSLGFTTQEEINLVNPVAGTYTVAVLGFAVPGTSGANFTQFSWVLGSGPTGNMAVTAPVTAVIGTTATIGLGFTGLQAGTKYLGAVDYDGGAMVLPGPTFIQVDR
jgi:uncharacterized membrane protein (Fun14 family)